MPRKYVLKNPYYRNSRISVLDTEDIVYYFLKGIKASVTAKDKKISVVTVHKIYEKLYKVIMFSGFCTDFGLILEEHEYMLWSLYKSMRSFLYNVDITYDAQYVSELGISQKRLESTGMDEILGLGRRTITSDQLFSCARLCDSETPPLVIQRMKKSGRFSEVLEKRLSCKNCPIQILDFYKPARNRTTYASPKPGRRSFFEPHYKYKEGSDDLMILWIEVLGSLSKYRNIEKKEMVSYAMQATISLLLKRAEYKVKDIKYGLEVSPIFLDDDQLKQLDKGYSYQSQIDIFVLNLAMCTLKETPI